MNVPVLVRALRIRQWSKNVFVLAPLLFLGGEKGRASAIVEADIWHVALAFLSFCLVSSSVYLFNGVQDAESDRAHPEKRKRPIASGELSSNAALVASLVLALGALLLGGVATPDGSWSVSAMLAVYLVVNVAYTLKLKQFVLLDAFCIASGFLLRVLVGGAAAQAEVSHWLILCTLFLALFLALNKRRAELTLLGEEGRAHRRNLSEYTIEFLDQMVSVLAACTIVCYTMYTVDAGTVLKFGDDLFWTVPFVAFGIGRYMLIVQNGLGGGNPARIFLGGDVLFLVNTLSWAATVAWVLYG